MGACSQARHGRGRDRVTPRGSTVLLPDPHVQADPLFRVCGGHVNVDPYPAHPSGESCAARRMIVGDRRTGFATHITGSFRREDERLGLLDPSSSVTVDVPGELIEDDEARMRRLMAHQ